MQNKIGYFAPPVHFVSETYISEITQFLFDKNNGKPLSYVGLDKKHFPCFGLFSLIVTLKNVPVHVSMYVY